MEQNTEMGSNKTGIDMSPVDSKKMIEGIKTLMPDLTSVRTDRLHAMKNSYLDDAGPLGTVPMPGTVKGVVKSTVKTVMGHHPEVFINKLGERLAYERGGVRIYDQLILKCESAVAGAGAESKIPLTRLREFRGQELQHFEMLSACLDELGADPTAQTPDADASAVAASGLMKVILDPRTSVSQSLQAMLAIELADNAAWELLIQLADDIGMDNMAEKFQQALEQEAVHLKQVRGWYEETVRSQGT